MNTSLCGTIFLFFFLLCGFGGCRHLASPGNAVADPPRLQSVSADARMPDAAQMNRYRAGLLRWIKAHRDPDTGIPYSHIGDERFERWAITYDAAVVSCAFLAAGEVAEARKIVDYYSDRPELRRLNGIIEACVPREPPKGEDWSVRTGANAWMGIAAFHLYRRTGERRYLAFAGQVADFALSLQEKDRKNPNFGGIALGPEGDPAFYGDQCIAYDPHLPSFSKIYATEINIDVYALCRMLYTADGDQRYREASQRILGWLKRNAYNAAAHRFNRGYRDTLVATDVQSWGVSALGSGLLDTFAPGLAGDMIDFVEANCISQVGFRKPGGETVQVTGVDFIDRARAVALGRAPLVSPEWTFQFINACRGMERYNAEKGDTVKAAAYREKAARLLCGMLELAVATDDGLAYPYATSAGAVVGHEYATPCEGNLSVIGAAYALLVLEDFDPLASIDGSH